MVQGWRWRSLCSGQMQCSASSRLMPWGPCSFWRPMRSSVTWTLMPSHALKGLSRYATCLGLCQLVALHPHDMIVLPGLAAAHSLRQHAD